MFVNNLQNGNADGNIQCRNSVLTKLIKDNVVNKQYSIVIIVNIHTGVDNIMDTKLTLKDAIQFRNIDHKFKNFKKISNIRKPDIMKN